MKLVWSEIVEFGQLRSFNEAPSEIHNIVYYFFLTTVTFKSAANH